MKILSIETSCDETALALLEAEGGLEQPEFKIVETALHSQIDIHRKYGGVYPNMAKRAHAKNLIPLLEQIMKEAETDMGKLVTPDIAGDIAMDKTANITSDKEKEKKLEEILEREPELLEQLLGFVTKYQKPEIDMLAVTSGPGLEPALWVGINFARALSLLWDIPLIPVNHMEGHIVSVLIHQEKGLQDKGGEFKNKETTLQTEFPALALLISGGHTELVIVNNWGHYEIIGKTLDDAVGEAYDKVARMLDLPYPGGPEISKLAELGRKQNKSEEYNLPRPMLHSKDYNFSFSGLKTAVLYLIKKLSEGTSSSTSGGTLDGTSEVTAKKQLSEDTKIQVSKEFEQAVVDVLNKKTTDALQEFSAKTLIVGGGVIANRYIRENLKQVADENGVDVLFPTQELSTDNAVMIGIAGYLKSFNHTTSVCPDIQAEGNLSLG